MPDFRRLLQPGGCYFFTVVTEGRQPILTTPTARTLLRNAIIETRNRWAFEITAIVLLPDHFHTIWEMPQGDDNFSRRWAFLKRSFTSDWLRADGVERHRSASRIKDRRRAVWQRRFWEHLIRNEIEFERHCNYIHYNPVKHGLASCPHAWPHTSFHRMAKEGLYEPDWCCSCDGKAVRKPSFERLNETAME